MVIGDTQFEKSHISYAGGAAALAASYIAGTFFMSPFLALALLPPALLAGVFLLLGTSTQQSTRLENHPEITWWLSTLLTTVAGFIAGWAVAAKTLFWVGGFDAEYVITRDYGISVHLLDYLILVPAILFAALGSGAREPIRRGGRRSLP